MSCCFLSADAQELKRAPGSVQISFLPPPLENATYSLGIFETKTNKLVRRLEEFAPEKEFTVGLNGLITAWDGKDDTGKPIPPGRYVARGYAVGPLHIEGEDILGNDWTANDETLRIQRMEAIVLAPDNDDPIVVATLAGGKAALFRLSGKDGSVLWKQELAAAPPPSGEEKRLQLPAFTLRPVKRGVQLRQFFSKVSVYRLSDGKKLESWTDNWMPSAASPSHPQEEGSDFFGATSEGKGDTVWMIGKEGVYQTNRPNGPLQGRLVLLTELGGEAKIQAEALRAMALKPEEPQFYNVAASTTHDRLYLLEKMPGWERLRGLSWVETKEENGHPVSTWQTFFERNIRAPGKPVDTDAVDPKAAGPIEISLDENPLAPGKPQKIGLVAAFDAKGSYLATKDGLRLRQVSERPFLESAYLAKGKPPSPMAFFQYDGAATDEFSIKGLHRIMEFDAGEFEMTANGEKPAEATATEPPDL